MISKFTIQISEVYSSLETSNAPTIKELQSRESLQLSRPIKELKACIKTWETLLLYCELKEMRERLEHIKLIYRDHLAMQAATWAKRLAAVANFLRYEARNFAFIGLQFVICHLLRLLAREKKEKETRSVARDLMWVFSGRFKSLTMSTARRELLMWAEPHLMLMSGWKKVESIRVQLIECRYNVNFPPKNKDRRSLRFWIFEHNSFIKHLIN